MDGRRILVVDDDASARQAITLLLRIDRHLVTEATNGTEAIELVSRQPFDLVVLDFVMPEMLGGEVALKIKLMDPTLPILMLTAYQEKLSDSDKPVDAVLGKPFAVDELRSAMARILPPSSTANLQARQTMGQTETRG